MKSHSVISPICSGPISNGQTGEELSHQDEYRRLHRTHKERLTLPAKERYEQMKIQFPAVCERANLGYIASYLGITLPHSAASEVTKKSPEKKTACIQED